jgi:hypothetical protein
MRKKGMFESFVKHELKGVLKYREQKIAFTSPPPPSADQDRYSREIELNG